MSEITQKTEFNKRFTALQQEAFKWQSGWQDLSKYVDPTRGLFNGDRSKIGKTIDHQTLLDSHATRAKRITASGMQTGMTDPSRPWFKLTMENFILANVPGVREWVDEVSRRIIEVMNKSNIYRVFLNCYEELVTFGTGCFLVLEDFDDVIRGRSFTIGEYYLGTDHKGRVNAFAREFEMTASQMDKEFGRESLSGQVIAALQNNQPDAIFKIKHLIESNDTRIEGYKDFLNMPYRSIYWESGDGSEKCLAKRGFKVFPVIAPRWDSITTNMTFGYGPSWHALGDIRQLQETTKDKLIAQEKYHNPPMLEDASVTGHTNYLPGGITKSSSNVPNAGVRPAYQINPAIEAFELAIENLYKKIDNHMFADIFLMISNLDNGQQTAFEIAKREQEKMMLLGPILHGLNEEMHAPVIDLIFFYMNEAGMIPAPPQEIEGMELKVQYISILAQAQKMMEVQQIQQTVAFVGELAAAGQVQAWDNVDIDKAVNKINDLNGSPADIMIDKEQVAQARKARAIQQNQALAMEAASQAAKTGKDLSQSPVGTGSMLDVVGAAAKGAV
jgi:hypothetical protein